MSGSGEMIRRAGERLSAGVNDAAALAALASATGVEEALDPRGAAVAARKTLADLKQALATAQLRATRLDSAVAHVSGVLPFLEEGWQARRVWLQQAIYQDTREGLAAWLDDWFTAASSRRVDALWRLLSDITVPHGAEVVSKRLSDATDALAKKDWLRCHKVLQIGADGVHVGPRQVPDEQVRENLRLLSARLALGDRLLDQAAALLPGQGKNTKDEQQAASGAQTALRARLARMGRGGEPAALLAQAREKSPADLDVAVESIAQARDRGEQDSALDYARTAVRTLPSLIDADGDAGRLVDPPAELWIALAERARDEGDYESADDFLGKALMAAEPGDDETAAAVWEMRAGLEAPSATPAPPSARVRWAYLLAGHRRASAGQLERARRDYEAAASGRRADSDPESTGLRATAQLSWADIISATAQQRPRQVAEPELRKALQVLEEAQDVADASGAESWSYLTQSDLHTQLSRVPGADDRYEHEWAALLASARAVALKPDWTATWLTLAEAAMTRDLYLLAEAAARRAHEIEDDEPTRAGFVRALINTGQYEEAQTLLERPAGMPLGTSAASASEAGCPDDPWERCSLGVIALRQGRAGEAVECFAGVDIDPSWGWAWHSAICALAINGEVKAARRKSEEFMHATAGREGERSRLWAAAFDDLLHRPLDPARDHPERVSQVADSDDVKALRAQGEALILSQDQAGWQLIERAIADDPRPACIDEWEREDRPVLDRLAREMGFQLTPPWDHQELRQIRDRKKHADDPVTELEAARNPAISQGERAVRLTEAVLLVAGRLKAPAAPSLDGLLDMLATKDELAAEVAALRRHSSEPNGTPAEQESRLVKVTDRDTPEAPQARQSAITLRLPMSWFAPNGGTSADARLLPQHRELRELLTWTDPAPRLEAAGELKPDEYQILAAGQLKGSGHADPGRRYCPRDTLSLLPARVRTGPGIVTTDHGIGIPANLLEAEADDGMAALLTWSAAEVVGTRCQEVAIACGARPSQARPRRPEVPVRGRRFRALDLRQLAQWTWVLRGMPYGSSEVDWDVGERVRHQLIAEAAYFRWIDRDRLLWDALTDWLAAERAIAPSDPGQAKLATADVDDRLRRELGVRELAYRTWELRGMPLDSPEGDWDVAERVRHQLIAEGAYARWVSRGRPFGESQTDWLAAERAITPSDPGQAQLAAVDVDNRLRRELTRHSRA